MAKKKINKLNWSQPILLLALLGGLLLIVWAMSNRTSNPDSLAAEVERRVVCPDKMRPTLVCPAVQSAMPWQNGGIMNWWRRRKPNCNWQCTPLPSSRPFPSCVPRPACLDSVPRCLVPEPANGWCPVASQKPIPSLRPVPSGIVIPPMPKPSYCPSDLVCPMNCIQVESPSFDNCNICKCGSGRVAQ